jgi:hypothetical protein
MVLQTSQLGMKDEYTFKLRAMIDGKVGDNVEDDLYNSLLSFPNVVLTEISKESKSASP